jgi:threonine dehydratase
VTLGIREVRRAAVRIAGLARRTPLKPSTTLSRRLGRSVHLKLESMQDTGAFKLRGAANAILSLPADAQRRGVVTVSSGNHGRALAWVAHKLGIPAVVCLTRLVPDVKKAAIRELGAEVLDEPEDQAQATTLARRLADERGLSYVDPFDQPEVIAGQGTTGLEILEERPEVDTLIVPVGGGGLIAGIAVAARTLKPGIRIVGVTNDRHPAMYECLQAGRIVPVGEAPTLADALPGAIPADNRHTFSLCREHVTELRLVSERTIARGMAFALRRERIVLEGAGAVGLGLLLDAPPDLELGEDVAVLCTGDNVDVGRLLELARDHPEV